MASAAAAAGRRAARDRAGTARAGAGAARMLAWRVHAYGGPGELRLEEVRVPPLRAPDHLLVRVRAASLNPLDVAMTRGYGAAALGALRALTGAVAPGEELPLVCGRDLVGEVVRAGPAARLRPGARVWAALPPHVPGSHSQYALVRDSWASAAPESLTEAAAGGAPYAALTAAAAVRAAGLSGGGGGGARVLVLGLGGVGQAALQLLAARGHAVTCGCAGELRALALELGAVEALDRHEPEYWARIERGGPFAAVLDCAGLGGEEAGAHRWRCGRYVTLTSPLLRETDARGVPAGTAAAALRLAAQNARAPRASSVRWAFFSPSAADLEELRALADRGRYRVCVERVFPWWEGAAAYERAGRGAARGKLLLDFTCARPTEPDDARPRPITADATPTTPERSNHV